MAILSISINNELFFRFLKMGRPRPFCCIFNIYKQKFTEKTVVFSRIQTQIVGVEGERADHLTTTTAQIKVSC